MNELIKNTFDSIMPRIDPETKVIYGYMAVVYEYNKSNALLSYPIRFTSEDIPIKCHYIIQSIIAPQLSDYANSFWEPVKKNILDIDYLELFSVLCKIKNEVYGNINENSRVCKNASDVE